MGLTPSISFCVVAFNRPDALKQLLRSIRETYGDTYPIHVANHGFESLGDLDVKQICIEANAKLHALPFHAGASKARNILAQRADTEFLMIMDEDMIVGEELQIERLAEISTEHELHAVAPKFISNSHIKTKWWYGELQITGLRNRKSLRTIVRRSRPLWGDRTDLFGTDSLPPGVMLIRRQALLDFPYNETLKQTEALEWCCRVKGKLRLAVWWPAEVIHDSKRLESKEYREFRDETRCYYNRLSTQILRLPLPKGEVGLNDDNLRIHGTARRLFARKDVTLRMAAAFFNSPEIVAVEHWSDGWGGFDRYLADHQEYRLVGTDCTQSRTGAPDAILLRHVTDPIVLRRAVDCFSRRLCFVTRRGKHMPKRIRDVIMAHFAGMRVQQRRRLLTPNGIEDVFCVTRLGA